jgi:hypothetical protein
MAYAKIVRDILKSSLNEEDVTLRWLWVTLLVESNRYGQVHGTPQALARLANLPLKDVTSGLEILMSPDPNSTTDEHEGRRLERLETNLYQIINHQKYRDIRNPESEREKTRQRVARYRARKKAQGGGGDCNETCNGGNVTVTGSNPPQHPAPATDTSTPYGSTLVTADAATCSREIPRPRSKKAKTQIRTWCEAHGFGGWWTVYPNKSARTEAEKAYCFDLSDEDREQIIDRTRLWLARRTEAETSRAFVPNPPHGATFIRQERWNDKYGSTRDREASSCQPWQPRPEDLDQYQSHPLWLEFLNDGRAGYCGRPDEPIGFAEWAREFRGETIE